MSNHIDLMLESLMSAPGYWDNLARYLMAAHIAFWEGKSPQTIYLEYARDKNPIPEFWVELAEDTGREVFQAYRRAARERKALEKRVM